MGVLELYHYCNTELADVRTNSWLLMSSPIPIAVITFAYLYFVLRCGPRYMRDKSPYSCRTFIRFYNVLQIVTNYLIVYHIFDAGWYEDYFFYCTKPDYSFNPRPHKIAEIMWYVFVLKSIDYIETVLFVLRKKSRQISFLHLYHHVSSALLAWLFTKYFAHGMSASLLVCNSTIHVVMYTYYLLSSFGPKIQSYLRRIKRIITILQMVQFWWLLFLLTQILNPGCYRIYPGSIIAGGIMVVNLIINLSLFYNFYKKSYCSTEKKVE
ncbi:very long chain fatty acid elongase 4-like [Andrena cerasifolii]|uniref:very long chain fatty acid elongase 4-like n=1 Tax=Andrena cerasifolii TaxID=2819439 RepID=UPI00403764B9